MSFLEQSLSRERRLRDDRYSYNAEAVRTSMDRRLKDAEAGMERQELVH
jgi:hypothetical protein